MVSREGRDDDPRPYTPAVRVRRVKPISLRRALPLAVEEPRALLWHGFAGWAVAFWLIAGFDDLHRPLVQGLLAFLPIFLANVAFAKRFRESADSQEAFAINLLGTIVGGCLEYAALFLGYDNLLIVVGLFYLVAFLLVPRSAARAA